MLREAGNIAEKASSRKILLKHAELAISRISDFVTERQKDLGDEEKEVLDIVKANAGKTTTETYEIYKEKTGKSYRTFYRKLKALEELGLIDIEGDFAESGGRISRLKPRA